MPAAAICTHRGNAQGCDDMMTGDLVFLAALFVQPHMAAATLNEIALTFILSTAVVLT
jgi:hypothetical protein